MVEFCKCGSLIVDGRCSNKGCLLNKNKVGVSTMLPHKKASPKTKSTTKSSNPRKSSKCITYNLYEDNGTEKNYTID